MGDFLTLDIMGRSFTQVGLTVLFVLLGALALEFIVYGIGQKGLNSKHTIPYMLLTPAIVGISLLVVFPIIYELFIAFSNMQIKQLAEPLPGDPNHVRNLFTDPVYGVDKLWNNLSTIFMAPIIRDQFFFPIFFRTILWTFIQVFFHVVGGLALAMLLNRDIKGRGIYRTFLVIPWAVPSVIAVLAWRGEFNFDYGVFNILLKSIGLAPVEWKTDWFWNIVAMNMTNIWLGVPFMMVILLGGLQSIPKDFYEAAEIDGANAYSRFKNITLPMLQPVMTPAIIMGIIWTFNNFNVPFFINETRMATSDILVTGLFRMAFEQNTYGLSATFAFVIFAILFGMSIIQLKVTGTSDDLKSVKKPTKAAMLKKSKALAPEVTK